MNRRRTLMTGLFAAVAGVLAAPVSAPADDRIETVHFARGTSAATLSGTIHGYDGIKYLLGASAGQAISVLFSAKSSSCYFNVTAPGADTAMFNGSVSGSNEFSANLRESGNYSIQVYLMRNAARRDETCDYRMTIEIGGSAAR